MKLVTVEQMRRREHLTAEQGTSLDYLMDRAGRSIAQAAAHRAKRAPVLVLAGPGNNGGDGVTAARALHYAGHPVVLYTVGRGEAAPEAMSSSAVRSEDDSDQSRLTHYLTSASVVVDALLGIGQTRPVEGALAAIVNAVNREADGRYVIAVDVPTGVDADTGAVSGTAIRADLTLCMGAKKVGVALYPGAGMAGEIEVVDVGIPAYLFDDIVVEAPSPHDIAAMLPERDPATNKGASGTLLVVGGSRNFHGAPALAGMAALRTGAGLVDLAVPAEVRQTIAARVFEPVFRQLPDVDGHLESAGLPEIKSALEKARAVTFGSGMGLSSGTVELTRQVHQYLASNGGPPAVFDADGLNALAQTPGWSKERCPLVLTPHPGEMSRLTGLSIQEIQSSRLDIALGAAAEWGAVVVLKGAGTVIAAPNGQARINPTGGPNLATAGTGDVLAGVVGALLAQGLPPFDAAVAGVYLHGLAGDILRQQMGDVGTIAGDLIDVLPHARLSILARRENA